MNKNVTVSVRGLLVAAMILLALVVAYLLGGTGGTPAAATAATTPASDQRTLTMRGEGDVTAVPDQVTFDVHVALLRPDLSTALDDANTTLGTVLASLGQHGVAKSDTETTGLDMNPVYTYMKGQPPTLRGYRVTESIGVLVKDLNSAGGAISAAVDAGGRSVRVDDIGLKVGDPDAALGEARKKAVDAATQKAQEYASATGSTLGQVMTVTEVQPQTIQSDVSYGDTVRLAAAAPSLAPVPIRAGHSDLSVTVQVVWQLQ